ncbi:MAG: Smr/MutS family protein [Fidelibacterota bacterium]|nr:MAG: Smr/MutS family protein [Candidatus Neomarinimicrobiota bacterium]
MSPAPSTSAWDESLGDLLHFNQVLDSIGGLCLTAVGRERVIALWPVTDPRQLDRHYTATAEILILLEKDATPPLGAFHDVRPALQRLQRGASNLTPEDFHQLRQVLLLMDPLQAFFREQDDLTFWREATEHLDPWPQGPDEIGRVVDEDLTIKSTASRELQRLRAAIRKLEEQVRRRLDELHAQSLRSGWAQDEPIAWREGRLVIALKASHKRKLRGLIHGHSSSGATAFVEPLEVFDMNNELTTLRDDEKAEELRLLSVLTDDLRPYADDLAHSVELLYRLDAHLAQARWAVSHEAVRPRLTLDGPVELTGARNPVLADLSGAQTEHREVVPLDIRLGGPERIMLVSGPNAGGKTVVLLTVGLSVMLAQSGLFVPARRAALPLFQALYTDLGDRQSLEENLSTFSAHLANLKAILSRCGQDALVLLDELGTGTEPEAGAALGQTFLEAIRERGAFCLATTHLNRLKLWAQDEAGIMNAGMAFDAGELRPTYRLEIGLPGASFALEIARRMGLDERLLQRAQTLMPDAAVNLDELLISLEEDRAGVERLKAELVGQLQDIEERERQLTEKESEIKAVHRRAHKDALRDAEQLVADMNRRLEAAIAEVRRKGESLTKEDIRGAKRAVSREKQRVAAKRARLAEEVPAALAMEDVQPGMWVTIIDQDRPARVEKRYPGRKRVTVSVEGMRLTLPIDQLGPGQKPRAEQDIAHSAQPAGVSVTMTGEGGYRLDLRGRRGDEAVAMVDRFLNRAILANLPQVEIIHGKGTGALQQRVREFLEGHPQVKSFRFADFDAGGTGVTLAELK